MIFTEANLVKTTMTTEQKLLVPTSLKSKDGDLNIKETIKSAHQTSWLP